MKIFSAKCFFIKRYDARVKFYEAQNDVVLANSFDTTET